MADTTNDDLLNQLASEAQGPFEQQAVELVRGMLKRRADRPQATPPGATPAAPPVRTIPAGRGE